MAQKIQFSAFVGGGSPYTLSYNPNELVLNQGGDYSEFEVLDDAPVTQRWAYDGRERRMSWPGGLPVGHETMTAQVAVLRGYIGLIRYINFGDVAFGELTSGTFYKHRIIDLLENIRTGGKLKWESIVLIMRPEA